jgi:hypothetical protein
MNAGFATLKYLKSQLLAEVLREDTSYDAMITAIGQGVAAQFESFCNRKFYRTEDDTAQFSADREVFVLPRFPVEEVSFIEFQSTYAAGWEAQSISLVQQVNVASGLVRFGGTLGGDMDLVRLTYTGGYWWNTNEDATDAMPATATALPGDLLAAWTLQCQAVWDRADKLGNSIGSNPDTKTKLGELELVPLVKQMLNGRIRYQMT